MDIADRRKLIAAIVERVGVKLDPDDPAFILVELNRMTLEESQGKLAEQIEKASDKLNTVTTRSVDDFVAVANEALSKFIQRTNELKTTLDAIQSVGSPRETKQVTASVFERKEPFISLLWWLVPSTFLAGTSIGAFLAFIALK